jgi:hypothetical protein
MPLFSTPPIKQLPKKLRQLLSERDHIEMKQDLAKFGFDQNKRSKKSLRSPNKQVTLDGLAHGHRSRPSSAAGKRHAPIVTKSQDKVETEKRIPVLARHESAPVVSTINNTTDQTSSEMVEGQLISIPSNKNKSSTTTKGSNPRTLNRRVSAPILQASSPGSTISAKRLTRRRSIISLSGNDRKSRSKKRREQAQRDKRTYVNKRLRHVLGAMTHRKLSSGWESWKSFVQTHRYRNLFSAAQSILQHLEPQKRNPTHITQLMQWMRAIRLDCLRPLVTASGFDDSEEDNENASLLAKLCRNSTMKKYNKGDILFWQTEFGDHYHIVVSGVVGIYANSERSNAAKHSAHMAKMVAAGHETPDWSLPSKKKLLGKWVVNFNVGYGFGELALISWDRERKATAMAEEDDTRVLLVDRESYKTCLWHLHQADENLDERVSWLKKTDHFSQWNTHRLSQLAYSLTEKTYHRGDLIISEGNAKVDCLVLLHTGMCQGYLKKQKSEKLDWREKSEFNGAEGGRKEIPLALYEPGTFLGQTDIALSASRQKRQAMSVRALSSSDVKVYIIPKESYIKFVLKNTDSATSELKRRMIGLSELRDRQILRAIYCANVSTKMQRAMSPLRQTKVSLSCFQASKL